MRIAYLLVVALLLPGLASLAAADRQGEEFRTLDLTAIPRGGTYYLKCSTPQAQGVTDCGFVSLWQQSNGYPGLQSSHLMHGRLWDPDTPILS